MKAPEESPPANTPGTIYAIGHSTRSFNEFLAILKSHAIEAIADVRLIPKSRRYPHFADSFLAVELPKAGIGYLPFKSLGGRRRPMKDSPNAAWRNESFRGYADFLQTPAFETALGQLMDRAAHQRVATMCAEAVPWRCHRSLISDALVVRGWRVLDIFDEKKVVPHRLPSFARVEGLKITYPVDGAPQTMEPGLFS